MKKFLIYIPGIVLVAFGLLSLFMSSSVIFDLFDIRAKEGNYVLFIVWTNFFASIFYLFAAFGFFTKKLWTSKLLGIATIMLLVAFIGLLFHINTGALYETKTVGAMIFRITLTLAFAIIAYFSFKKITT